MNESLKVEMNHVYTSLGWTLDAKDRNCLRSSVHEAMHLSYVIHIPCKGQVLRRGIGSVFILECSQQTNKQA